MEVIPTQAVIRLDWQENGEQQRLHVRMEPVPTGPPYSVTAFAWLADGDVSIAVRQFEAFPQVVDNEIVIPFGAIWDGRDRFAGVDGLAQVEVAWTRTDVPDSDSFVVPYPVPPEGVSIPGLAPGIYDVTITPTFVDTGYHRYPLSQEAVGLVIVP